MTISLAKVHSVGSAFDRSPSTIARLAFTRSGVGTRRLMSQTLVRAATGASVPGSMESRTLRASAPTLPPTSWAQRSPLGLLVGAPVVDLGDVARGPGEEDDDAVLAVVALDHLLQVVDVVGRDAAGAGRGVAGEVDDAAEELVRILGVPGADDADLRVDGPGRLDDVRVALARVRDGPAVAHLEAAVEGDRLLAPLADAGLRLHAAVVGLADRVDRGPSRPGPGTSGRRTSTRS